MNVEQGSCVYITNALPDLAVVIVIAFDSGIYVNYLNMKGVLAKNLDFIVKINIYISF